MVGVVVVAAIEVILAVHVDMGTEMITGRWGTWEELLLGGAVLRHGTRDWNLVASELRTRTVSPCAFTPEVIINQLINTLIKLTKSYYLI